MTHGSLYSQFDSKKHLATEALGRAFDASAAKYGGVESLSAYVKRYLSLRHRDTPGSGCAIATLGCEVPRQGNAMRQAFTAGLRRMMERLTRLLGPKARRKCENEADRASAIRISLGRMSSLGSRPKTTFYSTTVKTLGARC
jgi:TetR/AcrR family transcriptional regulator, transcriptional repressor for nem operon